MSTPTINELCAMLTSADPETRDRIAYSTLARRIRSGDVDGGLAELGDRIAPNFDHPEIQARTFAPLILASLIARDNIVGELDAATVLRWRDAFATWYAGETDLRGYDEKLGWLHAVAHGADLLGEFGTSRHLDATALYGLLDLGRERFMTPTDYLFAAAEDDRLAGGLAQVLLREKFDAAGATGWLEPFRAALEAGTPGTIPTWVSNGIRTLNSLYVVTDRGLNLGAGPMQSPNREAIQNAIATCLRLHAHYLA